jgi:hypothetical protein
VSTIESDDRIDWPSSPAITTQFWENTHFTANDLERYEFMKQIDTAPTNKNDAINPRRFRPPSDPTRLYYRDPEPWLARLPATCTRDDRGVVDKPQSSARCQESVCTLGSRELEGRKPTERRTLKVLGAEECLIQRLISHPDNWYSAA